MIDLHRLPGEFPDLYEIHSRLAEARIPPPATVTHIYRAKRWRAQDERNGEGYSRRQRIRLRARFRVPFVFVPNIVTHLLSSAQGYRPPSHKGYAA